VVKDGFVITAVIVKAGNDANVYDTAPFHDMHAPLVGQDKNIPVISHYEVCGKKDGDETTPPTTPPETETPKDEATTPAKSPVAVPTEVPAGDDDDGSGPAGLLGLVLVGSVTVAGAAMVARRRFLHDS
jgi:hypothetical protein